jgi:hypothetical protein
MIASGGQKNKMMSGEDKWPCEREKSIILVFADEWRYFGLCLDYRGNAQQFALPACG